MFEYHYFSKLAREDSGRRAARGLSTNDEDKKTLSNRTLAQQKNALTIRILFVGVLIALVTWHQRVSFFVDARVRGGAAERAVQNQYEGTQNRPHISNNFGTHKDERLLPDFFQYPLEEEKHEREIHAGTLDRGLSTDQQESGRGSCDQAPFSNMNFCNLTLSISDRVTDLISRLSLDEKIGLMSASPDKDPCPLTDQGVPRLGIERYTYLVEVNTGVASRCLEGHDNKCSTTFASPALLAASFNRTVWTLKGDVISSEMRAYYHTRSYRGINNAPTLIGLHGYGPNVNLMRDPRWGRNDEVPSEDPFLAGEYAKYYTEGIQQRDSKGYLKMHASIKHYTGYSVETHREGFNGNIDTFNMYDSYLPAFEKGIVEGGSSGAMCSYASINGVPSCANQWLLQKKVREEWGKNNFLVSTDCGAVAHMYQSFGNHYASNITDAIVKTVLAGTDLEMGDQLYQTDSAMRQAVENHYLNVSESDNIDVALRRILYHRFDLGMFDPLSEQEYAQKDHVDIINSTEHQSINSEATDQGLVLLQNPQGILPIQAGSNILVVGPHAMSTRGLFEGYYGDFVCSDGSFGCVPTVGEQIKQLNEVVQGGGGKTTILASENVTYTSKEMIQEATRLASESDVVVACVGLDKSIEREAFDRSMTDIRLDPSQMALVNAVRHVSSKVVVVLRNGGGIAIEDLLSDSDDNRYHDGADANSNLENGVISPLNEVAIVEAFYPGFMGAQALAKSLFGYTNRWGLLPFSVYANGYTEELNFTDMSFTTPPGRSYRYYVGINELFPFGYGLSYTSFELSDCALRAVSGEAEVKITCQVKNVGTRLGDSIVLLFHTVEPKTGSLPVHPVPIKSLRDFSRITLEPSETSDVNFVLSRDQMALVTEDGSKTFYDNVPHEFLIQTHGGVTSKLSYHPKHKHSETVAQS